MSTFVKRIVFLSVILLLTAACSQVEPTPTPVLPTPTTVAMAPADTSLPPTAAPAPPTAVPPTGPGAPDNTWIKTYAADQDTVAGYVLPADDGGYFIVGIERQNVFAPGKLDGKVSRGRRTAICR